MPVEVSKLAGQKVTLLICGGIGAYKMASVASSLSKAGVDVSVVMTKSAEKFITPLTFSTLTGHETFSDAFVFDAKTHPHHITLGRDSDLVVVAPATANMVSKAATGLADDLVSTILTAVRSDVLMVPSMNTRMYQSPANKKNMSLLRKRGFIFMHPGSGPLACGEIGEGRLPDPDRLLEAISYVLGKGRPLLGRRVVVSTGATREPLDAVRFISNRSSGAQGAALAAEALRRGAKVDIIQASSAVDPPPGCNIIKAETAAKMLKSLMAVLPHADILIMAAAVSDFAPLKVQTGKSAKAKTGPNLRLKKTEDILQKISSHPKRPAVVVGFSAETSQLLLRARGKLKRKKVDLMVANKVGSKGIGFGRGARADGYLVRRKGAPKVFKKITKSRLAGLVMDEVQKLLGLAK